MRVKKWVILVFYAAMSVSFGHTSYTSFINGNSLWVIWGIASISPAIYVIYQIIKGDGWDKSYVVADQRIMQKLLISLSISFIFTLIFLVVILINLYNGTSINSFDIAVGALISSLFVFMLAQIFQYVLDKFLR